MWNEVEYLLVVVGFIAIGVSAVLVVVYERLIKAHERSEAALRDVIRMDREIALSQYQQLLGFHMAFWGTSTGYGADMELILRGYIDEERRAVRRAHERLRGPSLAKKADGKLHAGK